MSYLVFARKYRPQQFSDLTGQSHIATTLLNAFQLDKIHHAYLFTGTRGIGKTSAARIFAKALRCEHPEHVIGTPKYGIPCNECTACREVNEGSSLDVLEIDGASNNGVENVRSIRENVKYLPSRGSKKVYIIDEVHMLSSAAFNALLKTLEEPPEHVVFILATTEVQKIPATIVGRCQRYDFKRISPQDIEELLQIICSKESIEFDKSVLPTISRKADGSARDALSLLDQAVALCGNNLRSEAVNQVLSIVDCRILAEIIGSVFSDNLKLAFEHVQSLFVSGYSMKNLLIDLANTIRNAVFLKLQIENNEISQTESEFIQDAIGNTNGQTLQAAFKILTDGLEEISYSPLPRASMEMMLLRIHSLGKLLSLQDLVSGKHINRTSSKLSGNDPVNKAEVIQQMLKKKNTDNSEIKKDTKPLESHETAFQQTWKSFVAFALRNYPSLGSALEHAIPLQAVSDWHNLAVVEFGFKETQSFYYQQINFPDKIQKLEQLLAKFCSGEKKLKLTLIGSGKRTAEISNSPTQSMVEQDQKKKAENEAKIREKALQDPIVQEAQRLFGAKLVAVESEG